MTASPTPWSLVAGADGSRAEFPLGATRPAPGAALFAAIRRDRIIAPPRTLPPPSPGDEIQHSPSAIVHAIENQGSYVKVTLDLSPTTRNLSRHIPDAEFFRDPIDIGDRVVARWYPHDLHLLEDGSGGQEFAPADRDVALM